jgi:hypothetical protein
MLCTKDVAVTSAAVVGQEAEVDVVAQVELVAVLVVPTTIDLAVAAEEVVPRADVEAVDAEISMATSLVWIPSQDVFKRLLAPHLICPLLILQRSSSPEGQDSTSATCPRTLMRRR